MKAFAKATGFISEAERLGSGNTFEGGWVQRPGWSWKSPFGKPASDQEPAVHLNFHEAQRYCQWAGKRLPNDAEWGEAAYTERRAQPTMGFVKDKTYPYPSGDSPAGLNCLGDCGKVSTVSHAQTSRGAGHAEVRTTKQGVNGLWDMGANAWEWVDANIGGEKRTRGGSWWYGAASMRDDHVQTKPASMSAVYIGFRCAKDRSAQVSSQSGPLNLPSGNPVYERNKANVLAFYDLMFNQSKPREAMQQFGGASYTQHNPEVPDGKDAFIAFFEKMAKDYPGKSVHFKRVFADGNFVVLHSEHRFPGLRGGSWAAMDIFRMDEQGKVVEHWDVLQKVPAKAAHGNGMF
jgi:formylglycine-generating enzyme